MFRSILAVVVGYVAIAVPVMATVGLITLFSPEYAGAEKTGIAPTGPLMVELVLSIPAAMLGGYVTAWLAASAPGRHVAALAVLVLAFGIGHAVMMRGGILPDWHLYSLPIVGALGVLAGGWLRLRQRRNSAPATSFS